MADATKLEGQFVSRLHHSQDGLAHTVNIYPDTTNQGSWVLETITRDASTIWLTSFASQREAYDEFLRVVEEDGLALCGSPATPVQ